MKPAGRTLAEIIVVGTELTSGPRVDTNSAWLRRRLLNLDVEVQRVTSLPDDLALLASALRAAARRSRLILLSGGLGPTEDDRTLQAMADAAGVRRRLHPRVRSWLQERGAPAGRELRPALRRQARLPVGALPLRNGRGTAPAVLLPLGRSLLVALPGVPDEMRGLWLDQVEAALLQRCGPSRQASTVIVVGGRRESEVDALAAPRCRERQVELTTLAGGGAVELHLLGAAPAVEETTLAIARTMEPDIVSLDGLSLGEVVLAAARDRGGSLAVAESCTGGSVAAALTAIPGASDVFLGGVVTYTNEMKKTLLGVPLAVLKKNGAVSEATVRAMARGVRRLTGSTWSVAISGIAGPGGGSRGKPVGTVWIATAGPQGVRAIRRRLPGGRQRVQRLAAGLALDDLRRTIQGQGAGR